MEFQGIGVSSGVIIGKVFRLEKMTYDIKPSWVHDAEVDQEVARFLDAVQTAKDQLLSIRKKIESLADSEQVRIIDAHLLILEDRMLIDGTVDYIKRHPDPNVASLVQHIDSISNCNLIAKFRLN